MQIQVNRYINSEVSIMRIGIYSIFHKFFTFNYEHQPDEVLTVNFIVIYTMSKQ
jgi:hypothetical protein